MNTIFKFDAPLSFSTIAHQIPKEAKFLHLERQPHQPHASMWFLVDPTKKIETVAFISIQTGGYFNGDEHTYLGTYQENEFVWHIFKQHQ